MYNQNNVFKEKLYRYVIFKKKKDLCAYIFYQYDI